jgi:hypothetical protein
LQRDRARLQQSAHAHPGRGAVAARWARGRKHSHRPGGDLLSRRAIRRADPAARRIQPPPGASRRAD